jgi:hypothetical protein
LLKISQSPYHKKQSSLFEIDENDRGRINNKIAEFF